MSASLYDPDRRRRRTLGTLLRAAIFLLVLAAASAFAYQIGIERMKGRQTSLEERIAAAELARSTAEETARRMAEEARSAERRSDELAARLAADVPAPEVLELAGVVAERLAAGVPADRIAFFIRSASLARDCSEASTRRFVVATPIYRGGNTSVGFAGGTVTVSGTGESARTAEGAPQAWFDPARPVTLTFTTIEGEVHDVTGTLPITHAFVLGAEEHRFVIAAGERSFAEVTADRCPFP
jgi:hypothetical protein